MNKGRDSQRSEADAEIEREIRQGRKVTAKDVMARMAGPGAMKGASPISLVQQAETEIGNWLNCNAGDAGSALQTVLQRNLKGSERLLDHLEQPLVALGGYCQCLLESEELLKEIVREADVEWGRAMDERPYFQREGTPSDPDDPYTVESVRRALAEMLKLLPDPAAH